MNFALRWKPSGQWVRHLNFETSGRVNTFLTSNVYEAVSYSELEMDTLLDEMHPSDRREYEKVRVL